jgi:enoyl-CoA hydratase/carnithine racemase
LLVAASETVAEVGLERRGHVAVVSLRRPLALNAITKPMADRLHELLGELAGDRETWVVVLTADGERAFCAGADLAERGSMTAPELVERRASLRRMFASVREVPQPTIAAVFGYVLGGGFELALSCDLVVAAEDAVFGLPEGRVGLVPAGGGTFLLARAVGPARAKELIYTGRRLDAATALGLGLATGVVARDALDEAAMQLAEQITRSSPTATRLAKAAIRRAQVGEEALAIEAEEEALAAANASLDAAEGVRAFAEKRRPEWTNR